VSNDLERRVIAIAAAQLEIAPEKLTLESAVGDFPRWDSFAQVGLIAAMETEFNIAFDIDEVTSFQTLEDMAEALAGKVSPAGQQR